MNPKFYVKKSKYPGRCHYCGASIAEGQDAGLQKRSTGGWNVACMPCLDRIEMEAAMATPKGGSALETIGAMMQMLETEGVNFMKSGLGESIFAIDPELGAALGEALSETGSAPAPAPEKNIPLRIVIKQRALL